MPRSCGKQNTVFSRRIWPRNRLIVEVFPSRTRDHPTPASRSTHLAAKRGSLPSDRSPHLPTSTEIAARSDTQILRCPPNRTRLPDPGIWLALAVALGHQLSPDAMRRLDILLRNTLDRYKAHVRSAHCLTNSPQRNPWPSLLLLFTYGFTNCLRTVNLTV